VRRAPWRSAARPGAAPSNRLTSRHAKCRMPYCPRLLLTRPRAHGRGLGSDSQYHFELENQAGQALALAPAAREALVTGLALHDRAQRSLQQVAQCDIHAARLTADLFVRRQQCRKVETCCHAPSAPSLSA